jgi:ribosomal protein S18 acetylase RimI-like enzyme
LRDEVQLLAHEEGLGEWNLVTGSRHFRSGYHNVNRMSTPRYTRLAWDSEFLGFEVARIAGVVEDEESFTRVRDGLRSAGVQLAYWQPRFNQALRNFARNAGASFVGTHVRLERDTDQALAPDPGVEVRRETDAELEALAIAAGALSRFALDPRMPHGTSARLYALWMRESFGGAMGNEVLAARDPAGTAGIVTLKHEGSTGTIGLVAVAERCRGTGMGRRLVLAATARLAKRGIGRAAVVTQGENTAALRLYGACGYTPAHRSLIAHFWL